MHLSRFVVCVDVGKTMRRWSLRLSVWRTQLVLVNLDTRGLYERFSVLSLCGNAKPWMFLSVLLCELHSSCALRDWSARDVFFAGLRVVCLLSHPRWTFVGLDGDFTLLKLGEQTVLRELQSRSEDDALVELVACSSSSSEPLDLHACVDSVLVAIVSFGSEIDNFFSLFFVSQLALGVTVLCRNAQFHFILSGVKLYTGTPKMQRFRAVLRKTL